MVSKKTKLKQGYSDGLSILTLSIAIKTEQAFDKARDFFDTQGLTPSQDTDGQGAVVYNGTSFENKAAFIGTSSDGARWSVRFFGPQGANIGQNFLLFVVNLPEAEQSDYELSRMSAAHKTKADLGFQTILEFETQARQATIDKPAAKGGRIPSVKYEAKGNILAIGAEQNQSEIETLESTTGSSLETLVTHTVTGTSAKSLWAMLLANTSLDLPTIMACYICDHIDKVAQASPLLGKIIADIRGNYATFKVVKPALPKTGGSAILANLAAATKQGGAKVAAVLSKAGAYVARSLTGISNKLRDPASSAEASGLLVTWIGSLSQDKKIPNQGQLVRDISDSADSNRVASQGPSTSDVDLSADPAFAEMRSVFLEDIDSREELLQRVSLFVSNFPAKSSTSKQSVAKRAFLALIWNELRTLALKSNVVTQQEWSDLATSSKIAEYFKKDFGFDSQLGAVLEKNKT
jgi:hypothetical protein